jgi:hypothetical protein
MKRTSLTLLALVFISLTAANLGAQVYTYQYSGNFFTTIDDPLNINPYRASDRVTGTVNLPAPLASDLDGSQPITPGAWSFNDGFQTISGTGNGGGKGGGATFSGSFVTDDAGAITGWTVVVAQGGSLIATFGGLFDNGLADIGSMGKFQDASNTIEGSWLEPAAVPEFSTWAAGALVSLSLAFFAVRTRRSLG